MKHTTTGTIDKVFETKQALDGKKYRQFWLRTEEQKPQYIRFQLLGERCDQFDAFNVDDLVEVKFSISGKKKEKREDVVVYNNLNAYEITMIE